MAIHGGRLGTPLVAFDRPWKPAARTGRRVLRPSAAEPRRRPPARRDDRCRAFGFQEVEASARAKTWDQLASMPSSPTRRSSSSEPGSARSPGSRPPLDAQKGLEQTRARGCGRSRRGRLVRGRTPEPRGPRRRRSSILDAARSCGVNSSDASRRADRARKVREPIRRPCAKCRRGAGRACSWRSPANDEANLISSMLAKSHRGPSRLDRADRSGRAPQ